MPNVRPWIWNLTSIVALLALVYLGYQLLQPDRRNALTSSTIRSLEQADEWVLYSLNPISIEALQPEDPRPEEVFHDFPVLGKTVIKDPSATLKLLRALNSGIANFDGMAANCFNPRHGIRAKLGSEVVDLVICFECQQIVIHATNRESVLTDDSAKPVFDKALTDAGVPLPKDLH